MANAATKGEDDAYRAYKLEYDRERGKRYYYAHRAAILARLKMKRIAQKYSSQCDSFGLPDDVVRQMLTANIQEENDKPT